ncbi:uncharacterized protein LOC131242882 [Magnolia sinica]|uniref:uncharacterized protein LOC131242882 n=1 Tax=Magnolia sinica TaxID=86752 RepID=UPI002658ECA7|nr:uncharacterized protein LOC131242882 [Magnolia sinica]
MGSSNSPAYNLGFAILAGENGLSRTRRVSICTRLLDKDESMTAKTKPEKYHAPFCVRSFYSRSSKNSLNYRNSVYSCNCYDSQPSSSLNSLNGSLWSASEIAASVNGEIVKWGPPGTICTDSRNLNSGQWFFAIVGERFDGHDFVSPSLDDKGCVGVVGNKVCEKWRRGFIKVEGNTLIALEKLAKHARNRFDGHVVGLTGSVGKTTTRTMIALALESLGQVYQTHGNQNNLIGVALTLIGIPASTEVSVLELGMNRKGEISGLAQICRPSVRVILNVGHAHMENFSSLEEVAGAKGELLMEAKPGDVCVLNADDPPVMSIPVPAGVKKVLFGRRLGSDVRLVLAESIHGGSAVHVILEHRVFEFDKNALVSDEWATDTVEFQIHSPGLHLAVNACAAAAVAVSLGVPLYQVGESLSRFEPVHMRSELEIAENGIRIINDVYNANPTSMRAAIDLLKAMDCKGKRVAILGDMLELGATDAEAHKMVLNMCCDASFGLIACVGKRFHLAAENLNLLGNDNVMCAVDSKSIALKVRERLAAVDVVLVKGSRAMQMERVVDAIKDLSI